MQNRFEPIEVDGWLDEHTIGLNPEVKKIHLDEDTGAGKQLGEKDQLLLQLVFWN